MEDKLFLILKENSSILTIPNRKSLFSVYGWEVCSIPKIYKDFLVKNNINYFEISLEDAMGFKYFGDARTSVSVSSNDEYELDRIYSQYGGDLSELGPKVKIEVSPSRHESILKSMKMMAKILLEEEFDKRYNAFIYGNTELERSTWEQQLIEVKLYDGGATSELDVPLLAKLSLSYGNSLDEMVQLIKSKKSRHDSMSYELFSKLSSLKTEFNAAETIHDLNLLYCKYFNLSMPFTKEFKSSRPDIFDERGGMIERLGVGYNF